MQELSGIVEIGPMDRTALLAKRGYSVQIRRMLGIDVFPKTLVLRTDADEKEQFLAQLRGFEIRGFIENDIEYAVGTVYPIVLENGHAAGILVFENEESDPELVEIVAGEDLRQKFGLKDGDSFRLFAGAYAFPNKQ